MADYTLDEISFKTPSEAVAFCKWILREPISEIREEYTDDEWAFFTEKRERRLRTQVDDLAGLIFSSPMVCRIDHKSYFKLAKKVHKNPLSSEGATQASSRFNYKNSSLLMNRVVYFGQDKDCCYAEKFHLDIQTANYLRLISRKFDRTQEDAKSEFAFPEHIFYEYEIDIDKILVLTTDATYKALGIADRVVKNEWFSVNDEFEIPTSSQLLGTIARKQGYNGIMYTSVRSQTRCNLVLFEENTGELKDRFKIITQAELAPSTYEKFIIE